MHYLNNKELEAIRLIRNYLLQKGHFPSVRSLMKELGYKSPRSAAIILESLISKGFVEKSDTGNLRLLVKERITNRENHAETVNIPLLGMVVCGLPILAEENIEAYIPVSVQISKPANKYFLLKAKGTSMNEARININDGDLVLFKQQSTANNGDIVVALVDDEATIKEFQHKGDMIILKPKSSDKMHQPIILTSDFKVQGIVVTAIPY